MHRKPWITEHPLTPMKNSTKINFKTMIKPFRPLNKWWPSSKLFKRKPKPQRRSSNPWTPSTNDTKTTATKLTVLWKWLKNPTKSTKMAWKTCSTKNVSLHHHPENQIFSKRQNNEDIYDNTQTMIKKIDDYDN